MSQDAHTIIKASIQGAESYMTPGITAKIVMSDLVAEGFEIVQADALQAAEARATAAEKRVEEARAEEREACAQIVENTYDNRALTQRGPLPDFRDVLAERIRARSAHQAGGE